MENTKNLLCPCCETKLVYTHSDRYQDLCEHVSQPNREPSIKPAFQCPNSECIAHTCDVAWIEDGEYYTGNRPEGITYQDLSKALESKHGNGFAVNSWNWYYQLGKDAIKKRTREYHFWKYRVVVSPLEKGHNHPTEEQYQPRRFGWKFEWWEKGSEEGYWIHLTPIHRMIRHYVRSFNSAYKSAIYNPTANRSQIKDALEYAMGYRWGVKDDRSFAKIAGWIIRTFMPRKVKTIIELSRKHNISI
jgi:hypothetical protein